MTKTERFVGKHSFFRNQTCSSMYTMSVERLRVEKELWSLGSPRPWSSGRFLSNQLYASRRCGMCVIASLKDEDARYLKPNCWNI